MRKYLNAMLVLLVLIVVTGQGCTGEDKSKAPNSPYIGGTQGIVANFEELGIVENGIATIWLDNTAGKSEPFPLRVTVKNKGEADIPAGDVMVKLTGLLLTDFEGWTAEAADGILLNTGAIDKVSDVNKEGGEETINFGDGIKYIAPITGSFYDVNFFGEIIYKYKTFVAVPKACFNGDPSNTDVCKVDEEKDVFSSGAPIQVAKVVERPAGKGTLVLEFELENVGGGRVTKPNNDFDTRYDQLEYTVAPDKFLCRSGGSENEAKLIEDKAKIICTLKSDFKIPEDTVYTQQVSLTLSYKYKDIIHEQLRIKKP